MTTKLSRITLFIALGLVGALAFAFPVSANSAPNVTTLSAQNISETSTTLFGHEKQSSTGNVITWFEYGKSSSLTFSTGHEVISYPQSLNTDFSASISDLTPGTKYYFRAVTKNTFGISFGTILSFTTSGNPPLPPTVTTQPATNITETSANLNALVNPHGTLTNAWFEWGKSQALNNTTNTQSAGSGSGAIQISHSLQNLSPNTKYFFRAVGESAKGKTMGAILSFTTGAGQSGSAPSITTIQATNIGKTSATFKGSANPNGNTTDAWFEYGTTQSLGSTVGSQGVGSGNSFVNYSFSIQNLSPNTTYYFRAVGENALGKTNGSILSFTTQPDQSSGSAPSATTNSASSIGQTSAILNASVNPNGGFTDVRFEWGSSFSLGNSVGFQSVGNGTNNVTVNTQLFGLSQNTTYYFRVVAQNLSGTTFGSILSFTTQSGGGSGGSGSPSVSTNYASNIGSNNATFHGIVNPNSSFTNGWFEYGTSQSLGNTTSSTSIGSGNSNINFSSSVYNLSPNTIYYFRAVAQNSNGINFGNILSFTTSGGGSQGNFPSVSTFGATSISQTSATLQGFANANGSFMTAWFEWGTTQSFGNTTGYQSIGSGFSGSTYFAQIFNLSPNTTYYFRAVGQSNFSTVYGSVLSFTTNSGFGGSGNIPLVSTNSASFVETSSAQLNAIVDPRGSQTNARFEWGITPSLGNTTISRDMGSGFGNIPFSWFVPNLLPNRVYYYRVVATNNFGTSYGNVVSFITKSIFVPTPPIISPTPPTPPSTPAVVNPSLVLSPTADRTNPAPREIITYVLNYWNESDRYSVSRLALRITLSEGVEFISSSRTTASQSENVLSFNLENLEPLDQDSVRLTLRVRENVKSGDTLTVGAVMNYRDTNNASQSTSAYRTFTVQRSGFLASLFGFSIPFGWLLLTLIILLIIFLITFKTRTRREYYKN